MYNVVSWHCIHWEMIWFPFFWSPFVTIKITQKYFVSSWWELSRSTPLATFKHAQQSHRLSSPYCICTHDLLILQRQVCTSQPPSLILPIPNTPPPQASLVSLDAWDLGVLFICFVFYIPCISETIWYLSFSIWKISLSGNILAYYPLT